MSTILKFGENVEGYSVPVLNEREIRAAAGIMSQVVVLFGFVAFISLLVYFFQDYASLKPYVIFGLTNSAQLK